MRDDVIHGGDGVSYKSGTTQNGILEENYAKNVFSKDYQILLTAIVKALVCFHLIKLITLMKGFCLKIQSFHCLNLVGPLYFNCMSYT